MEEQNKIINEAITELKGTDEAKLKETISKWFEQTRNQGMKIGAQFISAAVAGVIEKNLKKNTKPSLRDHQRCIDGILKIISVQLNTQQNDSITENEANEQESSI